MRNLAVITLTGLACVITAAASAEELTLTTYYPAPYGAYEELTTTGNTYLATAAGKNAGIGLAATDTIQNKLDVEGSVAIGASYSGTSAAPANGLIVQGNVGIGTNSPVAGAALDVNGTIAISGTPGVDGSFVDLNGQIVIVKKGIITSITP